MIGVHDELKGQVPVVFATLKQAPTGESAAQAAASMQQRVVEQLGGVARPARVYVVNALPKTRSGKLLRRSIQALAESRIRATCRRWTIRVRWKRCGGRWSGVRIRASDASPRAADPDVALASWTRLRGNDGPARVPPRGNDGAPCRLQSAKPTPLPEVA